MFFLGIYSLLLSAHAYTTADYVAECESAGADIELPPDGALSCSEGKEIPVYINKCVEGKPPERIQVTMENLREFAVVEKLPTGGDRSSIKCDTMSLLNDNCDWGSRIQKFQGRNKDSVCVVLCRREELTFEKEKFMQFRDINMICTNQKTGATCFFNSILDGGKFKGEKLPRPGTKGDKFWQDAAVLRPRCTECHDSDPFIVTPWLQNETLKVIPTKADGRNPRKDPFWIVGDKGVFATPDWRTRRELIGNEAARCTSCHRIGEGESCGKFAKHAVRPESFHVKSHYGCKNDGVKPWMPPGEAPGPDDLKALAHIMKCCEKKAGKLVTDGSNGCQWRDIPTPLAPLPRGQENPAHR